MFRMRFAWHGNVKEIARIMEWHGNVAIVEAKDGFIYSVHKSEMESF